MVTCCTLQELKKPIVERRHLDILVQQVLLPHSQMDRYAPHLPPPDAVVWSTVFRNASGVLRYVFLSHSGGGGGNIRYCK